MAQLITAAFSLSLKVGTQAPIMSKAIPDSHLDILKKPSFAHLATLMPDGAPQSSPVWVDFSQGRVIVNSTQGRIKDQNMRTDPRVSLSITDPDNPYRGILLRGRVIEITTEGADDHIDAMAKKYLNQDRYPFRQPGEVRVLYYIEPDRVSAMG